MLRFRKAATHLDETRRCKAKPGCSRSGYPPRRWQLGSSKVIKNNTIRQNTHDFLFDFQSNYICISCRFGYILYFLCIFVYFLFLHCVFICVPSCTNFINVTKKRCAFSQQEIGYRGNVLEESKKIVSGRSSMIKFYHSCKFHKDRSGGCLDNRCERNHKKNKKIRAKHTAHFGFF